MNLLDNKIESLKEFEVQKGNEISKKILILIKSFKENCVSTRIKELIHEDHYDFELNFHKQEKIEINDKELKDIQLSFAILENVEYDSNFILN